MPESYDVIIAGLGAMGSAAAYQIARRGKRVLGLDRFAPPHTMGSSHGRTRIIREAYFEHPVYVPLVQRAYELWEELERSSGDSLLQITGGLMIGAPDSIVFSGAKRSAEMHRLRHEILTSEEVRRRFPALQPDEDMMAVFEPRAGILFPERCIAAHLSLAAKAGTELHFDEPVLAWSSSGDGVEIKTARDKYRAGRLIISAGSWASELLSDLNPPLTVERQVLFWFEAKTNPLSFRPASCPVHLWQTGSGEDARFFYGFPDLGDGIKVACHHDGSFTRPAEIDREVRPEDIEKMRDVVRRFLPNADGLLNSATVCMYTNTPDEHFWLDHHPAHPQVIIASPCSGHGFKFASAVGEVLSDLALDGSSRFDLHLFRGARFKQNPHPAPLPFRKGEGEG